MRDPTNNNAWACCLYEDAPDPGSLTYWLCPTHAIGLANEKIVHEMMTPPVFASCLHCGNLADTPRLTVIIT